MKFFVRLTVSMGMFFMPWFAVHALTVNSLDCSGIDVTDGNVDDWKDVTDLVNTDESVVGTTYYMQNNGSWTTDEPDDWRYSANLAQQANIQRMKVCNTDTFFMMLRTEEPMMFFYDKDNDTYVDFWNGYQDSDNQRVDFTLPGDYHYWMVWKLQDVEGTGSILYFAADLTMDEGRALNGNSEENDRVPKLFLYRESDEEVAYENAQFDPNEDTQLEQIELSQDDQCNEGEECEPAEDVSKSSYAFEVSQDISVLFQYADFHFGDTINLSAAMYNSDEFSASNGRGALQLVDETEIGEYTFSVKPVRNLTIVDNSITNQSTRLSWRHMKNATSYTIKLINPENDKTVRVIKKIKKNRYTLQNLQAGTSYRAIVRAVLPKKSDKRLMSAWSSGVKWTTEE